ncbi:MAG: O-methyltransferase [Thermoanaerobaculia bacterium]
MANPRSRGGEPYATPAILRWLDELHAPHDAPLQEAFDAPGRHRMPPIQLGVSEARLLELLVGLVRARRVVEIGTLAAYSAIRIARALPPDGRLWTIEADPKHAAVARESLEAAGLSDRVTLLEGPALGVLPSLDRNAPFDAVFIDADKGNYDAYGRWAAGVLAPGGLLIADNVYLFGKLMGKSAEATAMRRFHEESARAFDSVCIPTPDGLLLGVKR